LQVCNDKDGASLVETSTAPADAAVPPDELVDTLAADQTPGSNEPRLRAGDSVTFDVTFKRRSLSRVASNLRKELSRGVVVRLAAGRGGYGMISRVEDQIEIPFYFRDCAHVPALADSVAFELSEEKAGLRATHVTLLPPGSVVLPEVKRLARFQYREAKGPDGTLGFALGWRSSRRSGDGSSSTDTPAEVQGDE
jgi:hypothetical protein